MSTLPGVVPTPPAAAGTPHTLQRLVTWKSAFVVSLGGSILVAVSLGPIAADLGPASVFVWSLIALVGVLQCLMIAEMATMFPDKSGGTATYTHEAFKKWPLVGATANWGYWLGWVPVIATNMVLIAGYVQASFFPQFKDSMTFMMSVAIGLTLLLYAINYFGLRTGVVSSVVMSVCALGPLAVIALSPIFRHSLFHAAFVSPFVPLGGSWHSGASWMLMFKDMFLALWSAYAFEAASTVVAEVKNPKRDGPKAMIAASAVGIFAYCLVPFMLLAIVGTSVVSQDPSIAFLPAATAIFGHTGGVIVTMMLIAALLLGAQTAIIGPSRTLFEMSKDGQVIRQFGTLNKHDVPVGSMVWTGLVTLALLLIFKTNVPNIVAASNIGYMLVWMLLLPAYVILRLKHPDLPRPFKLPNFFVPIAIVLTLFNTFLFFVGGYQWGLKVIIPGFILMLTFVPFYLWRRLVQNKQPALVFSAGHGLPEAEEGEDDLAGRREVIHREG